MAAWRVVGRGLSSPSDGRLPKASESVVVTAFTRSRVLSRGRVLSDTEEELSAGLDDFVLESYGFKGSGAGSAGILVDDLWALPE